MDSAWNRVEELMDASLQILNHMEVHNADSAEWEQLTEKLKQQKYRLQSISGADQPALQTFKQTVAGLQQQAVELERHLQQDYQNATEQGIDAYEEQSLDEQMKNDDAYHGKIDDKSAIKLIENLAKLDEELNRMLH
ncbi:hypothetical protein [Paenibacillus senegalensis]|uniref:hypothetical protein n=1 Tax=Paenibacillus senegalensis TaxID=1465766 RepID=UPI0002890DDF|nr:hypothetical protein [Paenibacillus senegalensis]